MKNEDRLREIVRFVEVRTGVVISEKDRHTGVIDARALYYKIALKDTRSSINVIGKVVGKSHATVIHSRKNVFPFIEDNDLYMNIYREFFRETKITDNERAYRELCDEDKAIYDDRAALVLKSFEWKRKDDNRKEVFEIINISQ